MADDTLQLSDSVKKLPKVGPARASQLARLGIHTVEDLLRYMPFRHEQQAGECKLGELADKEGDIVAVRGEVDRTRWVPGKGYGKGRFELIVADGTGRLHVSFFNASFLRNRFQPGMEVWMQGKIASFRGVQQMASPQWKTGKDIPPQDTIKARLRPVYMATEGLSSEQIESLIEQTLPRVATQWQDSVPESLREKHQLLKLGQAITQVHLPATGHEWHHGRRRLAYEELLRLQLGVAIKRAWVDHRLQAPAMPADQALQSRIVSRLPYELTAAQTKCAVEIFTDMAKQRPMNRLLQGDVGSGKTAIAASACLLSTAYQKQSILMAPTEVLAEQHFKSISALLKDSQVEIALLTGRTAPSGSAARKALIERVKSGEIHILVGTHALLAVAEDFPDLGLVVIDEQHRFGVAQRAAFRDLIDETNPQKIYPSPHHLVMTATPIPRTLAMTLLGDLDLSILDEVPPGRIPIQTYRRVPKQMVNDYAKLRERLEAGDRVYIVVPAVEASMSQEGKQLKSAHGHAEQLAKGPFCDFNIAIVHGQMKAEQRMQAMADFRDGTCPVLVATTVIEVGVDVPEASVIVIEDADRFGLAQLHQLRGRIGRGVTPSGKPPICLLVSDALPGTDAHERLQVMVKIANGFELAEMDFDQRGMGELYGTRQSGLSPLKIAELPEDNGLLRLAREDAHQLIASDPNMDTCTALKESLVNAYGDTLGLADVS